MSTALPTIPDVLGINRVGFSTMIECKTTVSDFHKDKKKIGHMLPKYAVGDYRYYLFPDKVFPESLLPEDWGLAVVRGGKVYKVKDAPLRKRETQQAELLMLASAVHRHELGVGWDHHTAKFDPYAKEKR